MRQRLHVDLPVLPSPPFRRCSDLCKALLSPILLTLPLPCPSCVPFCLRCSRPLPPPRHTVASPCTYHYCPPPPPRLHMRMVPLICHVALAPSDIPYLLFSSLDSSTSIFMDVVLFHFILNISTASLSVQIGEQVSHISW